MHIGWPNRLDTASQMVKDFRGYEVPKPEKDTLKLPMVHNSSLTAPSDKEPRPLSTKGSVASNKPVDASAAEQD